MNMNYSYDYEELLNEIKGDLAEELIRLSSYIKIVRGETVSGYRPIIDYYYDDNEVNEEHERVHVYEVLLEMEYYNQIIK